MVFEGLVGLGIACLLAPAIAQFAGTRKKAERGYNWIAIGGLMFILASAFAIEFWTLTKLTDIATWGSQLFQVIGWIFLLVGVLSTLVESFR
jgi:hypothetical protein